MGTRTAAAIAVAFVAWASEARAEDDLEARQCGEPEPGQPVSVGRIGYWRSPSQDVVARSMEDVAYRTAAAKNKGWWHRRETEGPGSDSGRASPRESPLKLHVAHDAELWLVKAVLSGFQRAGNRYVSLVWRRGAEECGTRFELDEDGASIDAFSSWSELESVIHGAQQTYRLSLEAPARPQLVAYNQQRPAERESLSTSDILRVIVDHKPQIIQCMQAKPQGRSGKIILKWSIRPSGGTTSVDVQTEELRSSPLGKCLVSLVRQLQFPRHQVQGEPIVFPFTY
jgi:hypothetical protein